MTKVQKCNLSTVQAIFANIGNTQAADRCGSLHYSSLIKASVSRKAVADVVGDIREASRGAHGLTANQQQGMRQVANLLNGELMTTKGERVSL